MLLQRLQLLATAALFSSLVLVEAASVPQLSDLTKTTPSAPATSKTAVSISDTATDQATTTQSIPRITGTATKTSGGGLTGLPKLAGQYSYPPATVPPTQNAPYMRVSSLPEGTVFIAVGSFLGFLASTVLLWRMLVAWSLHRSVKRAAMQQQILDNKTQFLPMAPMYKYSDRESKISLGHKANKGRPVTTALPPDTSSLFFSPTGAAAAGSGGLASIGNRGSNYLPAGYYASSASAPGGGAALTHIGGDGHVHRENIGLSNLRPQSQAYPTPGRASPPGSPNLYPQHHRVTNLSTSTLDLGPVNAPRTTAPRAPSAFFEDLMDESSVAQRPPHERF